jgi:tartrate dehydratase alpha subunit/fumarate hydratase class I-like protein
MSYKCFVGPEVAPNSIPVEWHDDRAVPVPIEFFNYEAVDSLEGHVREALARDAAEVRAGRRKRFLLGLIEQLVSDGEDEIRREAVSAIMAEVIRAEQPKQKVVCIGIAAGMPAVLRKTEQQWADIFGVSKQDIQQGVKECCERFGLRKNRTMRDEEARKNMQLANFRPKEKRSK